MYFARDNAKEYIKITAHCGLADNLRSIRRIGNPCRILKTYGGIKFWASRSVMRRRICLLTWTELTRIENPSRRHEISKIFLDVHCCRRLFVHNPRTNRFSTINIGTKAFKEYITMTCVVASKMNVL